MPLQFYASLSTLQHTYLQTLEEKLAAGGGGASRTPEPILTCVQCQEEYKESQNAEGYCKYHPSPLQSAGWDYMYVVFSVTTRLCHHCLFNTASGAVIRRTEIMTQLNLFLAVRKVNIAVNTMRITHTLLIPPS